MFLLLARVYQVNEKVERKPPTIACTSNTQRIEDVKFQVSSLKI